MNDEIYIKNSDVQLKDLLGTTLFESSNGITVSGTLNDDISNYKRLGCYALVGTQGIYVEIELDKIQNVEFVSCWCGNSVMAYKSSIYHFNAREITRNEMYTKYISGISELNTLYDNQNENGIKLYKVIGYKY